MSRKPRTSAEREAAKYKARETFERDVQRLQSWDDGWRFVNRGPSSGEPGGSYYSNLAYFIRYGGSPPFGAGEWEFAIYDALVKRLGKPTPRSEP